MKISLPEVLSESSSLPSGATLAVASPTRKDVILTLNDASGGPFYVKRGAAASPTNWTWKLITAGQTITIENYHGILTVSPVGGGAINVAIGTADLSSAPNT